MEQISSALVFPETMPSHHAMAKLLYFFRSLSYYLAAEPDHTETAGKFPGKGLCTGYVPVPLGDDLVRFKRLLREMATSRPGDFSSLFSAAKAPEATGQIRDRDEASSATVFSALHKARDAASLDRRKERLWQARLILKLAEILDTREEEVRQGLAQISSLEQKIFAALDDPDATDPDDQAELPGLLAAHGLPQESPAPGSSPLLLSLRVKAWVELFLADPSEQRPIILATASPDSGAILLDGYENTWRRVPEKLFSLSLPPVHFGTGATAWDRYLADRDELHAAAGRNLEQLEKFLAAAAGSPDPAPAVSAMFSDIPGHIDAWEKSVERQFSGSGPGLAKLSFYAFPGVIPAELLQRALHLEPMFPPPQQGQLTSILAVLQPAMA